MKLIFFLEMMTWVIPFIGHLVAKLSQSPYEVGGSDILFHR